MRGRIESGQLVTLEPVVAGSIAVDDIVFLKWKGNYILHLVKEIKDGQLLIANNVGKTNGWVPASDVVAKVTAVVS